jgi:hypothetical protein
MMSSLLEAAHKNRGLKKTWGYRLAIKSKTSVIDESGIVIESAASLCEGVKKTRVWASDENHTSQSLGKQVATTYFWTSPGSGPKELNTRATLDNSSFSI